MAYTVLLRRLGIAAVPHGFRSSFKDWCMEARDPDATWFPSEAALAHNLGNSTEQAYARTDLLETRRPLMEEWAQFLASNTHESVSNKA
jgi:integrase